MVNPYKIAICGLGLFGLTSVCLSRNVYANNAPIVVDVSADACEDRQEDDDVKSTENRAIDKASASAVKLSGLIQKYDDKLNAPSLDVITYRIIDEYMFNVVPNVTLDDGKRVCVGVKASVSITEDDLKMLITTHKNTAVIDDIVDVADKIKEETSFKPQDINEKSLLYIDKMSFWNSTEDAHYTQFLTDLFSNSDYYYVTENKEIADYVVKPNLVKSEVDKVDEANRKMQITLELNVNSPHFSDFSNLNEQQNHFILFSAEKDEQEVADTLIRKLLTRAAGDVNRKINHYSQYKLEYTKVRGLK